MHVGVIGIAGTFPEETRRLPRFLGSSLVAHGVLIALFFGLGPALRVPLERPLKVRIVPESAAAPSAREVPAGPAAPVAQAGRPEPPELIETPKPRVEQAPRSKRFAGLYDRRGGPGSKVPVPDAGAGTKNAPKVGGGSLRGEEPVRAPVVPPHETVPPITLPAPSQEALGTKPEPIPPGRTALVQPAPRGAGEGPSGGATQGTRPSRPSLRDQVASLGLTYRPPVDDPGHPGGLSGRGEPGLDTFRFKYATWGLAVKRDIERAWKVPTYGISSVSIVRFIVLPDGRIRNLELEKSAGLTTLDEAATKAIADAAPFRPFPPRMREENPGGIEIVVNFYYREGRGILQWE